MVSSHVWKHVRHISRHVSEDMEKTLPTDWSPKNTSLYLANGDTVAVCDPIPIEPIHTPHPAANNNNQFPLLRVSNSKP